MARDSFREYSEYSPCRTCKSPFFSIQLDRPGRCVQFVFFLMLLFFFYEFSDTRLTGNIIDNKKTKAKKNGSPYKERRFSLFLLWRPIKTADRRPLRWTRLATANRAARRASYGRAMPKNYHNSMFPIWANQNGGSASY